MPFQVCAHLNMKPVWDFTTFAFNAARTTACGICYVCVCTRLGGAIHIALDTICGHYVCSIACTPSPVNDEHIFQTVCSGHTSRYPLMGSGF